MSDLISRSDLIDLFEEKMFNDKLMNPVIKLLNVVEIIEEQPTIEVAPVVHGKWVKYSFSCVCTQCETEFDDDIRRIMGEGKMPNFCPECGAKMDGGADQ